MTSLPKKKVADKIDALPKSSVLRSAYMRYAEANIPLQLWDDRIQGISPAFKEYGEYVVAHMSKCYREGLSICIMGDHDTGKTRAACYILRHACLRNYSAIYVRITDMIESITSREENVKNYQLCDWLVIDDCDPCLISDAASDLFGRQLQIILRARLGNQLPTIICTPSPNPTLAFHGPIKTSIDSLWSRLNLIIALVL